MAQHFRHRQDRPQRGKTETPGQQLNGAVIPVLEASLAGNRVDEDKGVGVVSFWQWMSEGVVRSRSRRTRRIGAVKVKSQMLQRHDKVHSRGISSKFCVRGSKGLVMVSSGVLGQATSRDWWWESLTQRPMPASTDAKVPAAEMSSVQADHGKLISGGDSDWRSAKKCMVDWKVTGAKEGSVEDRARR